MNARIRGPSIAELIVGKLKAVGAITNFQKINTLRIRINELLEKSIFDNVLLGLKRNVPYKRGAHTCSALQIYDFSGY